MVSQQHIASLDIMGAENVLENNADMHAHCGAARLQAAEQLTARGIQQLQAFGT